MFYIKELLFPELSSLRAADKVAVVPTECVVFKYMYVLKSSGCLNYNGHNIVRSEAAYD